MATLKQLKIFLTVAETLQMSEAARLLYLSQSTVSQAILDLEQEFDAPRFQRGARQLTLTSQGMVFREHAQQVAEGYEQLGRAMEQRHAVRELRLGATLTIGNTLLASILHQLKLQYPDIHPYLYVENTHLLEARLLRNEVDLCLIEGIVTSEKLAKLPLVSDVLELICAPEHPFWDRTSVMPEELRHQPFILREQGSGTREIFENTMRMAQVPIQVVGESVSSTAIMELVMENMGLGVLSHRCVAREAQEGTLHTLSIRGYPMNRYFQICYALRRPVTSQMRDFMQTARQTIAQGDPT